MTPQRPDARPPEPTRTPPRKRHRGHTIGIWSLVGIAALVVLAVIGALAFTGRPIEAPVWLRDRIEARIDSQIKDVSLNFGDIVLQVDSGWRPHIFLRDVTFSQLDGTPIVSMANISASLAMRPLLKGRIQPKRVSIQGVVAELRRGPQGQFELFLSGNQSKTRQAGTLAQLIKEVDSVLTRPNFSDLVGIDVRALTLRYEDVRVDRAWTVDGGRLRLDRDGQILTLSADLAVLSGGDDVATLEANYESTIGSVAAEFGVTISDLDAADIATQAPALAWLNVLKAPISGAFRGRVLDDGSVGPFSSTLQIGAGAVQPTAQTLPIPFQAARAYVTFDPKQQTLRFDELSVQSAWVTGRAEGQATLHGIASGKLDELIAQFTLSEVVVNPAALYPHPVALAEADLDFRLTFDPFVLTLGQAHVSDQGQSLLVRGELRAAQDGWQLALDGEMDGVSQLRVLELWPMSVGAKTRTWLEENLSAANLKDIELAFRANPNKKPELLLNFQYADAGIRFSKHMPVVNNASGHATILRNRFVAVADQGYVQAKQGGRIDVAGTSFIVPDVSVKDGPPGVARLRTSSTVTAALSLLDSEPLNVMTKADVPVTIADGRLVLQGTLAMPLKKGITEKDIEYFAKGSVFSVRSSTLVPGRVIAADVLNITANNTHVRVAGSGRIGAVGFDGKWDQPLGGGVQHGSTVSGTIELSERTLDEFKIGLPQGMVSGSGQAAVQIGLKKGTLPTLDLRSSLKGMSLQLKPLGWSKPPQADALLQVAGTLGPKPEILKLALDAPGMSAIGTVATRVDGGLDNATFSRVQIGGWFDAPVVLTGTGPGRPPNISVPGGSIDLRAAQFADDENVSQKNPSGTLSLQLDSLKITDAIVLNDFQGQFSTQSGLDGTFTGNVNGGTPISGRLVPKNRRFAVRIQSTDAGGVFRSAGVLKQLQDGDMTLTLVPVGPAGSFDGTLRVTDTRLTNAPVMAEMLNAVSVVGLLEQLDNQGIHFSEVDGQFRLTPTQIIVTSGSAVGNAIGLSIDGVFDVASSVMDMQGVITPVYLLNGIGSVLTRKGEGVIGFNFTLTGNAKSPTVQVNPLSVLTPAMFREIFRRPAPVVDGQGGGIVAPVDQPAPRQVEQQGSSR
jgi:hypothetical protein